MTEEEIATATGTIMIKAQTIEALLVKDFGAEGNGIVAKAMNVEGLLAEQVFKDIRRLGYIRNQVAHVRPLADDDLEIVKECYDRIAAKLIAPKATQNQGKSCKTKAALSTVPLSQKEQKRADKRYYAEDPEWRAHVRKTGTPIINARYVFYAVLLIIIVIGWNHL